MSLLRFLFPFLFVRNWHTGQHEASRPRIILFCGAVTLIVLGLVIAFLLQLPVEYQNFALV